MVEWTDFERATIQDIFSKIDVDVVGPAALSRLSMLLLARYAHIYLNFFKNATLNSTL